MPDQILFKLNDVEITTRLARFGGTTYQVSNIVRVSVHHARQMNSGAVALLLAGLIGVAIALHLNSNSSPNTLPVLTAAVAAIIIAVLVQVFWPKRIYTLVVRTTGNDTFRLSSEDGNRLNLIRDAIEDAFAKRI